MSDSKDESDGRERPRRGERPDRRPQSGGRDGTGGRAAGDRPAKRPYSGGGEKRSDGDRNAKRPYGDRDAKRPYSGAGEKRSYGDRDAKRPYGDRDAKRPYGDRDGKRPYSGGGEKRPYGDRDAKRPYSGGEKRPYGDRDAKRPYSGGGEKRSYSGGRGDDRRGGRPDARGGRREEREPREKFGAADLAVRPRHDDPEIPDSIEARDLEKSARAELKTLSKENADSVARHLVAASMYLDVDPGLAHRHALSAGRRAGRVAVVRETLAITAYATGDFGLALRELRTYRRISGRNDQLPLMVDSERGVGRPDRALEVGRSVDRATLPAAVQVGLAIAMSGARLDLGQPELALAELEIPQLDPDRAFSYSPALFSAYAEVLEELGRTTEAAEWRARAARTEEALGGPAESELVEIFEVELEDDDGQTEEPSPEASVAAAESEPIDDPGAVLEDDVAAVLAEGDDLERESGEASADRTDTTEAIDEDAPDGPVPHED